MPEQEERCLFDGYEGTPLELTLTCALGHKHTFFSRPDTGEEQKKEIPEGCKLQAYFDEGWLLEVVNQNDDVVAILAWPEQWKSKKNAKQLERYGFEIA